MNFVILFALTVGGFVIYKYFAPLPFDSARWKASSSYEKLSIRYRMTDSLLTSKQLDGLNYFQVVSLLGKPNQHNIRGWNMVYTVEFSIIDPIMLVIKFDKRKQVVECDVQTFN